MGGGEEDTLRRGRGGGEDTLRRGSEGGEEDILRRGRGVGLGAVEYVRVDEIRRG